MRFIPALFLILTFQSSFALDEFQVADYRCWLFTGVVAACFQVIPQVVEIVYAHALNGEARTAPYNTTAPYIFLFSTTSTISNGVALLAALPLVYNAAKGVAPDGTSKSQHCCRRTMEVAFAVKTLMSLGMQTAATYLTFNLYNSFNDARATPDALFPTFIAGGVSLGVAFLPIMGATALVVKSACMARKRYSLLVQHD
jgi:hypothetical protein